MRGDAHVADLGGVALRIPMRGYESMPPGLEIGGVASYESP